MNWYIHKGDNIRVRVDTILSNLGYKNTKYSHFYDLCKRQGLNPEFPRNDDPRDYFYYWISLDNAIKFIKTSNRKCKFDALYDLFQTCLDFYRG